MKKLIEVGKIVVWYSFLILFVLYSVVVGIWLFFPYSPILVQTPIQIMNPGKQVRAGEILTYKIKYEKLMNVSGTLTRKLINSYKIDLSDSVASAPIGKDCDQVKVTVPRYADPGTYYLWWHVEYQVNPLRTIPVSVMSEKFEVIK
jgi:hypothetical protein